MNHNRISLVDLNRVSAASIHNDDARFGHRSDENEQNEKASIQKLSLICDDILAAEKQDVNEVASERIHLEIEKEDVHEEILEQDIREQGEVGAISADGAWKEHAQAKFSFVTSQLAEVY